VILILVFTALETSKFKIRQLTSTPLGKLFLFSIRGGGGTVRLGSPLATTLFTSLALPLSSTYKYPFSLLLYIPTYKACPKTHKQEISTRSEEEKTNAPARLYIFKHEDSRFRSSLPRWALILPPKKPFCMT
jgi:hypothetical protein